ncbi:GNAT family N-acetyltransferase [Acinetobacter sp. YZS-X1-1]|uniref:GNAT family N-acetyltransferase n=1 Tax=Acinetobacter sp. YZS-X1-1 TaxID=1501691 RepID=UPI00054CC5C7|nr:GNAT family N-acetyltransferase [Acinetobacter sp. YZS-X1-1]
MSEENVNSEGELQFFYIDSIEKEAYQSFECERGELNSFLIDDAIDYHNYGLTKTTLVFESDNLIGFFSLSADKIVLTRTEIDELALNGEYPITYFPAVKITKLAVDKAYAGKGYGRRILELIEGIVYGHHMAVRFLTLDAVNEPKVLEFYQKNGFEESLHEYRQQKQNRARPTILMHKDIFKE